MFFCLASIRPKQPFGLLRSLPIVGTIHELSLRNTELSRCRGEKFFAPTVDCNTRPIATRKFLMKYNPDIHHRRSIRLRDYDYSQAGAYFVTICTHNHECLFGEIADGVMMLNASGRIAAQCWREIPSHFPHSALDEWVIMPNHLHGIVILTDTVGAKNFSPLQNGTSKTIGSIVRGFKIGVTKWMRQHTDVHTVWQRNYWEHIIRDDADLHRIRQYICNNPARWEEDSLHP